MLDFAVFADAAGASTVTTDVAVAWAILPQNASPVWAAQRLSMVRGFARYLQSFDPATQVPPAGLLPARTRRATPYIYSDAEVAALMATARMLPNPLKAATFETLIGLLSVTGTRGSEVMALDRCDLDAAAGLLTVRATKFRKSRQLPLQVTTLEALAGYQALRDRLCPAPATDSLLAAGHVEAGPLGGHHAGHRPAGLGRGRSDRFHQRPVVIWQVARAGCLAAPRHQQPEAPLRRSGAGCLAVGGYVIGGHQLGDDLPGYHQPFQLVLGVGELLAQQLDLTGQLGDPAGDPFRQLHPAPRGYYRANRDGHRR